ncbi:MAG: hypothetical protein ACPGVU_01215 [Limisphaerales bacterium]
MKTTLQLLLMLGLVLAGFSTTAGERKQRTSKRILGESYKSDVGVLEEAQKMAIEMGQKMLGEMQNPTDRGKMAEAMEHMKAASTLLADARSDRSKINSVIKKQELAFQILLQLAAKDKRIMKGQKGKKGSKGQSQRMKELELKMKENQYQNRRLADPEEEQNQQQNEALQFLNRLRELAQRQGDINERLKELQTQLQAAKDEQEKEEIRRQLKRLLEEQKRVLEDIDELNQRMQQSENNSQMADAQKELQEARQAAQQTAKSLDGEKVSKALASGTRAEESFKDLKDDFRKETAGRFAEDMRQMRQEVREMNEKQKELNKDLKGTPERSKRQSLASENKDEKLSEELKSQNDKLGELLKQAQQVSQQSEYAEPLLHRQIYDAIRNQVQRESKNIGETAKELGERGRLTTGIYRMLQEGTEGQDPKSLEIASELTKFGFKESASSIGERSAKDLDEFQRQIEKAAESVLGNEADALRQARREIDSLLDQIGRELSQKNQQMQTNRYAMAGGQQPGNEQQGQQPGQEGQRGQQGQQPGQEGQRGQQGQQSGQEGQRGQQGQQPGQEGQRGPQGQQPGQEGQRGQQGAQPGQRGQEGQQTGRQPGRGNGQPGDDNDTGSNEPGTVERDPNGRRAENPNGRGGRANNREDSNGGFGGILPLQPGIRAEHDPRNAGPITGEDYADWADRMRNVEEMVSTDDMRNRLSTVRERVRKARAEFKRHSKEPKWALMENTVMSPLVEIRDEISDQLARMNSREAMVPIDRDPVPTRFADAVRRYYEKLGKDR